MFADHGTREHWHLPAPFLRDSAGGHITLPIARPTLHWVVLVIGLTNATGAALSAFGLQHHTAIVLASHTASVLLAGVVTTGLARFKPTDRTMRAFTGLVGLTSFVTPGDITQIAIAAIFIGAAVLVTSLNELGFRLAPCDCGSVGEGA
jgi:hypothetical protein